MSNFGTNRDDSINNNRSNMNLWLLFERANANAGLLI